MTTLTLTGKIGSAIDNGGYFGPIGVALTSQDYTLVWTADPNNVVIEAVMTINGMSYTFDGPGYLAANVFTPTFQRVSADAYEHIYLSTNLNQMVGRFFIQECCDTSHYTQAFFGINPGVPGPEVGAFGFLPALLMLFALLGANKRRRTIVG